MSALVSILKLIFLLQTSRSTLHSSLSWACPDPTKNDCSVSCQHWFQALSGPCFCRLWQSERVYHTYDTSSALLDRHLSFEWYHRNCLCPLDFCLQLEDCLHSCLRLFSLCCFVFTASAETPLCICNCCPNFPSCLAKANVTVVFRLALKFFRHFLITQSKDQPFCILGQVVECSDVIIIQQSLGRLRWKVETVPAVSQKAGNRLCQVLGRVGRLAVNQGQKHGLGEVVVVMVMFAGNQGQDLIRNPY